MPMFKSHLRTFLLLVITASWVGVGPSAAQNYLPGQIRVHPDDPSQLVYDRDEDGDGELDPYYMAGPGGPENFLYRGDRTDDGTRTGGDQDAIIDDLENSGGNALYFQVVRSDGGDGEETHNPFVDPSDPSSGLDEDILDQWDDWFTRMDDAGITLFLILYDDGADPFGGNAVSEEERSFVEGIVNRFEDHEHLIWVVAEEYSEALSDERASEIASTIADADGHDHVIAIHQTGGVEFDFPEDPEIDQFAMQTEGASSPFDLHESTKEAVSRASDRYHVNMAEDAYQRDLVTDGKREELRKSDWAVAMAGAHLMAWGMWEPEAPSSEMLGDLERLRSFMEGTDYAALDPADDRAHGDTDWVLSDGDRRHIAYATDGSELGVRDLEAGTYRLEWFDPADGDAHEETVTVDAGDRTFAKPSSIGSEAALWMYPEESTTTAVPEAEGPGALRVGRVHPNPFNSRASIRVAVDRTQRVEIAVYDVLGRRRSLLFEGRMSGGAPRTFDIDASGFPTGWYLLRIRGAEFEVHRTMTLLK